MQHVYNIIDSYVYYTKQFSMQVVNVSNPKVVAILGKWLNDKASISRNTIICQQPRNTYYIAKKRNAKNLENFQESLYIS